MATLFAAAQDPIKTGVAAAIGTLVYQSMPTIDYGFWIVITAVIVMQANIGASIKAAAVRIVGTCVGALFGALMAETGVVSWWSMGCATACSVLVCQLAPGSRQGSRLAGVTAVIVLVLGTAAPITTGLERATQTFLGILIAVAVAIVVWPLRARDRLRSGIADVLRRAAQVYLTVYDKQTRDGEDDASLERARQALHQAIDRNQGLAQDASREPAPAGRLSPATLLPTTERLADHLVIMDGHNAGKPEAALVLLLQPELEGAARATLSLFDALALAMEKSERWPADSATLAAVQALRSRFVALRREGALSRYDMDSVIAILALCHGMMEVAADLGTLLTRASRFSTVL